MCDAHQCGSRLSLLTEDNLAMGHSDWGGFPLQQVYGPTNVLRRPQTYI